MVAAGSLLSLMVAFVDPVHLKCVRADHFIVVKEKQTEIVAQIFETQVLVIYNELKKKFN